MRMVIVVCLLAAAGHAFGEVTILGNRILTSVNSPALIVTQPASQTKTVGEEATFVVDVIDAVDLLPLLLQWQFNGVDIPGATSSSYTISVVQLANAGGYRCHITTQKGVPVDTNTATLVVYHKLRILSQLVDHPNGPPGSDVAFTVEANGEGALNYQWAKDGTLPANYIAGATMQSYKISNVQTTDNGNYGCVITDSRPADGGGPQVVASSLMVLNVVALPSPELTYTHAVGASTMTAVFNAHGMTLGEILAPPGAPGKSLSDVTGIELVFKAGSNEHAVRYAIVVPADGDSSVVTINGAQADYSDDDIVIPSQGKFPFELAGFTGQVKMSLIIGGTSYGANNAITIQSLIQGGGPKTELVANGIWRDISTP